MNQKTKKEESKWKGKMKKVRAGRFSLNVSYEVGGIRADCVDSKKHQSRYLQPEKISIRRPLEIWISSRTVKPFEADIAVKNYFSSYEWRDLIVK